MVHQANNPFNGLNQPLPFPDALPGLACALMWGVSPVLTIKGLDGLDAPLLGVTLGMVASTAAYGLFLAGRRRRLGAATTDRTALAFKVAAGVAVALSTWWRWSAATSSASRARCGSGPRWSSAAPSP